MRLQPATRVLLGSERCATFWVKTREACEKMAYDIFLIVAVAIIAALIIFCMFLFVWFYQHPDDYWTSYLYKLVCVCWRSSHRFIMFAAAWNVTSLYINSYDAA